MEAMASDGLLANKLGSAREHQRMVLSRQRAVLSLSDCLTLSMKYISSKMVIIKGTSNVRILELRMAPACYYLTAQ